MVHGHATGGADRQVLSASRERERAGHLKLSFSSGPQAGRFPGELVTSLIRAEGMRTLTRYVVWELLTVFLLTLGGMTLLILLVGVAQEAIRQGLGIKPVLQLIPYLLPNALRFAVPGTVLFAACIVYGRMSWAGEVLALKSLGISPMVVIWPGLILSLFASLVAVWLNDIAVTWGKQGVQRVVIESVEQIAYGMLRTQRSYSTRRFSINVKQVVGRKLIRPVLVLRTEGDSPAITLSAREAELRGNLADNTLIIFLRDGIVEVGDQASFVFADTIERRIPLLDATRKDIGGASPSNCPLGRIGAETGRQRQRIRQIQQQQAAVAAYQMVSGNFAALTGPQWNVRRHELDTARYRLFRLQTEPWRRWAAGFSCFFFVIAGIPLAIRLRNSDMLTSFFLCFLPILLVYYPLLAFGVERAKGGVLPPYTVWLGNAILLLAGLWLLRKVLRY
jgi:lipopolysaccharide export system permease protein